MLTFLTALATGPKSVCLIWDYNHYASMLTLRIPLILKTASVVSVLKSRTVVVLVSGEGVELSTMVWLGYYSIPPTLMRGVMVSGRKGKCILRSPSFSFLSWVERCQDQPSQTQSSAAVAGPLPVPSSCACKRWCWRQEAMSLRCCSEKRSGKPEPIGVHAPL